jgi:DMSO/TMAO reductase YedYZ molybdopterin-dependent catalytic subunit
MISRRDFLKSVSATVAAANAIHSWFSWAADSPATTVPGKDGMILRSLRFLDLEMPPEYANSFLTPVSHSLGKFEPHTVINTLECAGNGRAFANPHVPGIQWTKGAVGTARFSGPRLRDILQRAGLRTTGKDVMFRGLDDAPGKVPPFIRSIPLEKAMDEDMLVATQMNGDVLPRHHGYPARALVPGWIGGASCKWLTEIKVLDKEFEGNFMSPGYRMPNQPVKPGDLVKPEDTHPLTALSVKSFKVEISTDAGATWYAAELGKDRAKYAWRLWSYQWKAPKSGVYVVMSRASDTLGRVQPERARWNPSGYLNNSIDRLKIHVQA